MDLDDREAPHRRKADQRDHRSAPRRRTSTTTMTVVWIAVLAALMLVVQMTLVTPRETPVVDDGAIKRRI